MSKDVIKEILDDCAVSPDFLLSISTKLLRSGMGTIEYYKDSLDS